MERSENPESQAAFSVPEDSPAEPRLDPRRPPTPTFRVLSGKGRGAYQSKGNQILIHLVRDALPRYRAALTNREKIQITKGIVYEIQAKGGQFWDPDNQALLTNEDARIKVAQLMRYLKREHATAPSSGSDQHHEPSSETSPGFGDVAVAVPDDSIFDEDWMSALLPSFEEDSSSAEV